MIVIHAMARSQSDAVSPPNCVPLQAGFIEGRAIRASAVGFDTPPSAALSQRRFVPDKRKHTAAA